MKHLAVMMRYELEQGDVDAFARLLNEHWEVSKKLDAGSTNGEYATYTFIENETEFEKLVQKMR